MSSFEHATRQRRTESASIYEPFASRPETRSVDCGLAVEKHAQIIHAGGRPREAEIVGHVTKQSDQRYCTSNYIGLHRARAISTAMMVEARA
jgi:hypothetical protein